MTERPILFSGAMVRALLAGARRDEDGSWSSAHIEYGEENVQSGFASAEEANKAFLSAQKKIADPFARRPRLRRPATR